METRQAWVTDPWGGNGHYAQVATRPDGTLYEPSTGKTVIEPNPPPKEK